MALSPDDLAAAEACFITPNAEGPVVGTFSFSTPATRTDTMKSKHDREQFVTALYAAACKDREELIGMANAILDTLKNQDRPDGPQIRALVVDVLAGIERRKAIVRLGGESTRRTP